MLRAGFFWIVLFITCGYALWHGRRYERISALICIAASVVSAVGQLLILHHHAMEYSVVQASDLVVDTLVLGAFIAVALCSDRFWPLWAAGLQLTISMSHVLKAIEPDLLPMAYAAAERFWSYPTLLIIMIGAWRQHQRSLVARSAAGSATAPA